MNERTLDALAGIIFIITILGLEYLHLDIGPARAFIWIFAILFHAYVFGKNALPKRHWAAGTPIGLLLLMAVQSVIQTCWFYAGSQLGSVSDAWSLAIAMAFAHLAGLGPDLILTNETNMVVSQESWTRRRTILACFLLGASVLCLVFVIWSTWQGRTLASIRTPWPLLAPGTLATISLLWITAALSAWSVRSQFMTTIHAILAMIGTLSISSIIYRLGYGFDGFLHIAGESVLMKTGVLNPKPFYYIGQYVFTTWLSRMTQIPLTDIDRWLVPVLAATLLPASLALAFRRYSPNAGLVLILACLPLSMFVATTPQGLAATVGLAAVILSLSAARQDVTTSAPIWLGLWSVAIHPLAGLPLLILAGAIIMGSDRSKIFSVGSWLAAAMAGAIVPLAFLAASQYQNGLQIEWNLNNLTQLSSWLQTFSQLVPWLGNTFTIWPAWASIIAMSLPIMGLFGALAALRYAPGERKNVGLMLVGALTLLLASVLLSQTSDFSFLISYERGDYAQRLLQLAVFILVLAAAPALAKLTDRTKQSMILAPMALALFVGSIGTANAYNSLPRHDAVQASRGWSVGRNDVDAVRWIDQYAKDRPYTVLANQTVSAAAVKEFGFKRYADDVFYYPIPTGGELYKVFLKMTYEDPSLDTIKDAARLGKSNLVFVVINDYWWKSEELNQSISALANDQWSIDNGKVNVYVFDVSVLKSSDTTLTNSAITASGS